MISFSVVQSTRDVERRTERSESFELTKVFIISIMMMMEVIQWTSHSVWNSIERICLFRCYSSRMFNREKVLMNNFSMFIRQNKLKCHYEISAKKQMRKRNFIQIFWDIQFSTKLISLRKKIFSYRQKTKNVIKSKSWHSQLINVTMKDLSLTSIIYWQGKLISYFDLKHIPSSTKILDQWLFLFITFLFSKTKDFFFPMRKIFLLYQLINSYWTY